MKKSVSAAEKTPLKPWTKPEIRKLEVTEELLALFRAKGPIRMVVDRSGELSKG